MYKVKRHLINVRMQQNEIITVVGYMIIKSDLFSKKEGHFIFLILGMEQLLLLFLPLTSTNLSKLWMEMFFRQHAIIVKTNFVQTIDSTLR